MMPFHCKTMFSSKHNISLMSTVPTTTCALDVRMQRLADQRYFLQNLDGPDSKEFNLEFHFFSFFRFRTILYFPRIIRSSFKLFKYKTMQFSRCLYCCIFKLTTYQIQNIALFCKILDFFTYSCENKSFN